MTPKDLASFEAAMKTHKPKTAGIGGYGLATKKYDQPHQG